MNNSSLNDVSYNSSDEDNSQILRPSRPILRAAEMDMEINQTADSFRQIINKEGDDGSFNDAARVFSNFYKDALMRKKSLKPEKVFEKNRLFDRYRKCMKVYEPQPNLYFLPKTIIISQKIDRILDIRDSILQAYGQRANVQIPKDTPNELTVTIHLQNDMSSYIIRSISLLDRYPDHPMPLLMDRDLSLNPLYRFYEDNFEKSCKFGETCGVFLYWAYTKRLLSPDYLTQNALKMIVMFFYFVTEGVPNVIANFSRDKAERLQKIKQMYRVNKKYECILDDDLFEYTNFSLLEKRSFFIESMKKYSYMIQILPVPFPVETEDIEQETIKIKKNASLVSRKEVFPVVKFFKIMEYLQNCIKRSERVKFDFVSSRKGVTIVQDIDFNIEIKHPIFGNNMCEKLTNDASKLRILKQEISNVVNIYRKCKSKPLQALTKVFDVL